jgi:tetratricopeptide (TPR) repeat protein
MNKKKTTIIAVCGLIAVTLFTFGQPKEKLAAHWTRKGRQAERAGRYKEALEDYRKADSFADDACSKHPELHAALLEKFGDMCLLNGEHEAARQYFGSAFQAWQSIHNGQQHADRILKKVRQAYGVIS